MDIVAYTSCSINYLPKARVLADSLKSHHKDATIILCLNDVVPSWLKLEAEPFDHIWQPSDLGFSDSWRFRHNVMEISTAVKGRALVRILEEFKMDLYLYLDPDVFVYHDLSIIANYMEDAEIGLVPHITKPEETEIGVKLTELSVVAHGTYNLGHLIIRDGSAARAFARWWDKRLSEYCFDDKPNGLFTDQRWCDLVPALFEKVRILRQPNLDVASWNIFGRKFEYREEQAARAYTVEGLPLLTYHFSGTGPNGTHRRIREIFAPGDSVIADIEKNYEKAIKGRGQAILEKFPYGGDFFDNGSVVTLEARQLYRNSPKLQSAYPHPYRVEGDSYYQWLARERPGVARAISLNATQISDAFSEIFDPIFYLWRYPEVSNLVERGAFNDAMDHYIRIGSTLLYDPNALFVSSYYNEEARKKGASPASSLSAPKKENTLLWHYLSTGLQCGLEPIEYFSSKDYLDRNPDVATHFRLKNVSCPFAHFANYGDLEGRSPAWGVSFAEFTDKNDDAQRLMHDRKIGPFAAYALLGHVKGRIRL